MEAPVFDMLETVAHFQIFIEPLVKVLIVNLNQELIFPVDHFFQPPAGFVYRRNRDFSQTQHFIDIPVVIYTLQITAHNLHKLLIRA